MIESIYTAERQTAKEKKTHEAPERKTEEPVAVQKAPEIVVHKNMNLGKSPLIGD